MDSWKLVQRLTEAQKDDPLWAELLRRCRTLIQRSLAWQLRGRYRGGPALLDDVTQEVMARLLARGRRGLHRFSGEEEAHFEGYIKRIAENLLLDQWRRELVLSRIERHLAPEEQWRLEAASSDPARSRNSRVSADRGVRTREMWELVEVAVAEISRDRQEQGLNRLLFRLYFWEGTSIPQITRLREVPLSSSTVARRINQLRIALRRAFLHRWFRASGPAPVRLPSRWRRRVVRGHRPRPRPRPHRSRTGRRRF